jgi:alpha-L-rhamnosidase
VPAAEGAAVTEGGVAAAEAEGVRAAGREGGAAVFEVGAGSYVFAAPRGD